MSVYTQTLTPHQARFLMSRKKYMWFCAGRGSGKTKMGSHYAYRHIINSPKSRGLICANAYHQLHAATLPPVLMFLEEMGMDYVVNKTPPRAWIRDVPFRMSDYKNVLVTENGAHIFLRSLDNYDYIRGIEIGWGWIDEISSSCKEAWDVVTGCLRDKFSNFRELRVTGTPDGDNWTWQEFKKYRDPDPSIASKYDIVFMSSRENPFLPEGTVEDMLAVLDRRKALQEVDGRILLEQEANIYHEFNRDLHVKSMAAYNPDKPLIFCLDFNASKESPMSAVIAQQHNYTNGKPFVQVIDEIVIYSGNTPKVCEEFKQRFNGHRGGVWVYGDATTNKAGTIGINDYQMIKEYLEPYFPNMQFHVPRRNTSETDRTAAVNAMLMNSLGLIRLFVHPKCKELITDFLEVAPDAHGAINKKKLARTHTSDALGYYIVREFPIDYRTITRDILNMRATQAPMQQTNGGVYLPYGSQQQGMMEVPFTTYR